MSPSTEALNEVRRYGERLVALYDHLREPEVARSRKSAYGIGRPLPKRLPTDAEVAEFAECIDAGIGFNTRIFTELMTVAQ